MLRMTCNARFFSNNAQCLQTTYFAINYASKFYLGLPDGSNSLTHSLTHSLTLYDQNMSEEALRAEVRSWRARWGRGGGLRPPDPL